MQTKRLEELDLLRGLSVLGMILVITPGAWGLGYPWLNHAEWEGIVAVDMIAPAFMFCLGFAIPLSLSNRVNVGYSTAKILRHIYLRGGFLIALGLAIHWFETFDISSLRIPGVLQRIGLTYIVVSTLTLLLGRKSEQLFEPNLAVLSAIGAVTLVALWSWFYFVPVPGYGANQFSSEGSWASYIDLSVFGVEHMWPWGQSSGVVTYDPDGLVCSLATSVNVLIGTVLGAMYQQQSRYYNSIFLLCLGCILICLGLAISPYCPIIKKIWTSSFVLFSSGVSILLFVLLAKLKYNSAFRKINHPLRCYGANALLAFALAWLGLSWYLNVPVYGDESLRSIGFSFFNNLVGSTAMASLLFGAFYCVLLYGLLAALHHKRWYLRL